MMLPSKLYDSFLVHSEFVVFFCFDELSDVVYNVINMSTINNTKRIAFEWNNCDEKKGKCNVSSVDGSY